jgi:hypothetical protein
MKPSICRFVVLRGPRARGNGAQECPAVITRVWSDDMVNVTAFVDCGSPQAVTSVPLFATEKAAQAYLDAQQHPEHVNVAYWPAKV